MYITSVRIIRERTLLVMSEQMTFIQRLVRIAIMVAVSTTVTF